MRKLERLKLEASHTATARGHRLSRFSDWYGAAAMARCLVCRAAVKVDTRPLPNGIDIGGEAVALNCNRKEN